MWVNGNWRMTFTFDGTDVVLLPVASLENDAALASRLLQYSSQRFIRELLRIRLFNFCGTLRTAWGWLVNVRRESEVRCLHVVSSSRHYFLLARRHRLFLRLPTADGPVSGGSEGSPKNLNCFSGATCHKRTAINCCMGVLTPHLQKPCTETQPIPLGFLLPAKLMLNNPT